MGRFPAGHLLHVTLLQLVFKPSPTLKNFYIIYIYRYINIKFSFDFWYGSNFNCNSVTCNKRNFFCPTPEKS